MMSCMYIFFFIPPPPPHTFTTAPPRLPYPTIDECANMYGIESAGNCTITTLYQLNITCSVFEFFPIIELSFRHEGTVVKSLKSSEWNNADGTKNMSVTITVTTSKEPYVCVASDIPGSDQVEEKTTMVFIDTPLPERTTEDPANWTTTQTSAHRASRIVRELVIH